MKRTLATAFLCLLLATPAAAQSPPTLSEAELTRFVDEFMARDEKREKHREETGKQQRELVLRAEKGDKDAQFMLGFFYEGGRGFPQDDFEALRWFSKAAEQGNVSAKLGVMYAKGQGVPQDYVRAHKWYNLAVTLGADAREGRDSVEKKMTQVQVTTAQKLAHEWWAAFIKKRVGK